MTTAIAAIEDAANRINWRRGYGDIKRCQVFFDGKVLLTIHRPFMHDTVRRATYRDGRLFYCGTSRKIVESST